MTSMARRIVLPAAVAFAIATPFAIGAALGPGPTQPAIASAVARTLETGHYARRNIDDALSDQWFDTYIDRLDYGRMYFLASDIEEFEAWRNALDDGIATSKPNLEPAYKMHARFIERMNERVAFAEKVLSKNDFSFDDPKADVDLNRHEDPWAKSKKELDALWRGRIAEQVLRMELAGEPREKSLDRLRRRYQRVLKDQEGFDEQDVLEVYLSGLTNAFDPHSVWFKPITKENFDIEMRDSLTGIGAVLQSEEGYTVIKELVAGGPAATSGKLEAGDKIVAVAQGTEEPVDIVDMRLDNVVQLIRGPIDTKVVLTIHPSSASDVSVTEKVVLVRDKVKLERASAKSEIRDVDGLKLGVIDVPSFYVDAAGQRAGDPNASSTARDMRKILEGFDADGVDAVVVDLRRNGGGSLDQAIEVTGLFIDRGPVVQIRDGKGNITVLDDDDAGTAWSKPVVVLTSELSASASEIFAGAIKDYGIGIVVGSNTTHGKGTVQNLLPLDRYLKRTNSTDAGAKAGALKFTTHMFFRVNGSSTQVKGVPSDITMPSPFLGAKVLEADLDNPLPWARIAPAKYNPGRLGIDKGALQAASDARVAEAMEFDFLREDLAERERLEKQTTVSLHKPTREAEIARRKDIDEARHAKRVEAGTAKPKPPEGEEKKAEAEEEENPIDPILDEALLITRDMVRQLRA